MSRTRIAPRSRRALLTSLSATAAAALASADRMAEAGIVQINVNQNVGFSGVNPYPVGLAGGNSLNFYIRGSGPSTFAVRVNGTAVKTSGGYLARVGVGKTFHQVGTKTSGNVLIGKTETQNQGQYYNGDNNTEIYSAFSFQNGATTDYGWFDGTIGGGPYNFGYNLDEVVYDDSGAMIATGQTMSAVPEPASLGLMMIGAVAMGGAAAVRRMKAARAAAA
jgi:hypothetical protein